MTSASTPDVNNLEVNAIELVASDNSKITNINLYSGCAEITRLFAFAIKAGQNKVVIRGLPRAFQEDSLRVEGLGNASIHDVIVEKATNSLFGETTTTQAESDLRRQSRIIEKALESAEKSRSTLNNYLNTINANDFNIPRLEATLDGYMTLSRKVDEQILDFEKELAEVMAKIKTEQSANQSASVPNEWWKASIDIHAQIDEEITLRIKYAVQQVDWTASYDIRVNTQAKDTSVIIHYKAGIIQNTGETWDSAPLTLQTVTPSFGVTPPVLHPWHVRPYQSYPAGYALGGMPMAAMMPPPQQMPVIIQPSTSSSRSRSPSRRRMSPPRPTIISQVPMIPTSHKGGLAATFQIPGLVNIPSDGTKHNVTVAQLALDADLTWYTIPAVDARVHLKAKISNSSEYTLVPGNANIYIDGSFIATTHIPSASPKEEFDCPLGLDSSIRVTYHPREKKSAKSGFYSKSENQSFSQRISVFNSKSIPVQNLKVIDRVPVSQDQTIEVKMINPSLRLLPAPASNRTPFSAKNNESSAIKAVKVAHNIIAQWDGVDEPDMDPNAIGRDGIVNWIVSIQPQKTVSIALEFEVSYPTKLKITGL